jgi:hypothetical protein
MPQKDSAGLTVVVVEEEGGVSAWVTFGLATWGGARTGDMSGHLWAVREWHARAATGWLAAALGQGTDTTSS